MVIIRGFEEQGASSPCALSERRWHSKRDYVWLTLIALIADKYEYEKKRRRRRRRRRGRGGYDEIRWEAFVIVARETHKCLDLGASPKVYSWHINQTHFINNHWLRIKVWFFSSFFLFFSFFSFFFFWDTMIISYKFEIFNVERCHDEGWIQRGRDNDSAGGKLLTSTF